MFSTSARRATNAWRISTKRTSLTQCPLFVRNAGTSSSDKKMYILRYEYTSDILEKRDPFRPQHLQNAMKKKKEGSLIMGGALLDPVDSAIFVFSTSNKQEIEAFVANDPYVQNHLVTSHSIREWMVVV